MHFKFYFFPLLVSGVQVGRLCWVGQEPAVVMAVFLELFPVSLLTGWQSSSHMYGFNSSCFSTGVFAVGRWITLDAGPFYQFG